jgi:hypothetical protein
MYAHHCTLTVVTMVERDADHQQDMWPAPRSLHRADIVMPVLRWVLNVPNIDVDAIPALGTGKMDLRAIRALATSLAGEVEAEAQA